MTERRKTPQPLTEAQLHWIVEQTEHAARKAGETASKRLALRATAGFLILLLGIAGVRYDDQQRAENTARDIQASSQDARFAIVESGNYIAVDGCNRDYRDRVEVRSVLIASKAFQKAEYERGNITKSRYENGRAFYNERLKSLPLPDCRKSAEILTVNPNEVRKPPEPLYPGSENAPSTENIDKDPGKRPAPGGGGG